MLPIADIFSTNTPRLGIAYGTATPAFLGDHPDAIDYVEVPYEFLRHDPSALSRCGNKPVILHCASLSVAGTALPSEQTVAEVQRMVEQTGTPWLGEHLSFVAAERPEGAFSADEYAPGEPYNIGYTVSPPMNQETVAIVLRAVDHYQSRFGVPLLLENPPLYFRTPGTTMTQTEFIRSVCEKCSLHLLLDLAHFYITSRNMGFDASEELHRLPLDRVVEVHLSGVACEAETHWDNHAAQTPSAVLDLLGVVLERAPVRAVTLEYNWSSQFPTPVLMKEIERTRSVIQAQS
jgi:uncharacterized protein